MLRKTLITLMAFAALSIGSTAMGMHGGGGGGGHGGGWGGDGGHGFSGGGAGFAAMHGSGIGSMMMHRGTMATAPMVGGRVQGWSGRTFSRSNTAWGLHDHFHDRFHHRFHHRNFFAFGFGGPIYDYAYDSCWTQVPTRFGWRWVYVCGGYY
jgi:hypothetical protein